MASIRKEISIRAPSDVVWAAIRDFGGAHRYSSGLVIDTRLDGDTRFMTFANGVVVEETLVDLDDKAQRLAYTAVGTKHHNASMQVYGDGEGSRLVWTVDFLPHDLALSFRPLIDQVAAAFKRAIETQAR